MKNIRFAHVSDTHVCKNYGEGQMKELFEKCKSPAESMACCLKKLEQQKLDFVLFTGDLVHEGGKEDYDYFLDVVRESMPNTKTVFALGNHDRKQPFFESMGLEVQEAYCHVEEVAGMKIVVLDSGVLGEEAGSISESQEQWLEKVLKEGNPEYGTILAFHHPIAWKTPGFSMEVSDNFRRILRENDIRAIFCGHTHENSVDFLEGIPQITADSTAFGCEITPKEFQMVEKVGYNIYTFDKENWQLHVEQAQEAKVLATMDMRVLMELMKKEND